MRWPALCPFVTGSFTMIRSKTLTLSAAVLLCQAAAFAGSSFDATYSSSLGSMQYRVYLPDNYQASGPNKTPVVLYLHSAAERGNSVADIFSNSYGGSLWTNDWINQLVNETQHGPHQAVLVMPQSGLGQVWNSMTAEDNWSVGSYTNATAQPISPRLQLAVNILDTVDASNNVDLNKVYVTGPSMGGYGTWDALARFPNKFSAGMPLSGGGNTDLAATVLSSKPIWAYHGGSDGLVPPSGTTNVYFASKQAGGSPIISYLASVGHGGFDQFYTPGNYRVDKPQASGGSGQDVYDWLFSQSLSSPPVVTPIPPKTSRLVIGFGGASSGNNRTDYTANGTHFIAYNFVESATVSDLHDINNASTGISISRTSGLIGAGGGTSSLSAALADAFPSGTTSGALYTYGQLVGQDPKIVFSFSGMDDSRKYKIEVFGAADTTQNITSFTQYTLAGATTASGQVNVINNHSNLVTFDNSSSSGGVMTLTVQGVGGSLGYINSLAITPIAVPEPTSLAVMVLGAVAMLGRRRVSV